MNSKTGEPDYQGMLKARFNKTYKNNQTILPWCIKALVNASLKTCCLGLSPCELSGALIERQCILPEGLCHFYLIRKDKIFEGLYERMLKICYSSSEMDFDTILFFCISTRVSAQNLKEFKGDLR